MDVIYYKKPSKWLSFDLAKIFKYLTEAEAAVLALKNMPIQRNWAEKMQEVQLKREVAGTSRIEGADFTENELNAAIEEPPERLATRSQRQAAAAVKAYRWIAELPKDRLPDQKLILEIHRLIVTGSDDDHCPPGELRKKDQNVTFGTPRHRGIEGGPECEQVFEEFCRALEIEFQDYNNLIQALAAHYHFAAMHPFFDGNGRTARALEAFMLQRAGLKDMLFIAMSNYYYEEKSDYLKALAEVKSQGDDLTPFLIFGLKGIKLQCDRLLNEIRINVLKSLFLNMIGDFFSRLKTKKKRVIAERQLEILKLLLESKYNLNEIIAKTRSSYLTVKNPIKVLIRDINYLITLGTISAKKVNGDEYELSARLEWATEITETEYYKRIKEMPKAKTYIMLSHDY